MEPELWPIRWVRAGTTPEWSKVAASRRPCSSAPRFVGPYVQPDERRPVPVPVEHAERNAATPGDRLGQPLAHGEMDQCGAALQP